MAVELAKRRVPAEYVTRSIVLGRGWTQGAIVRFLAEPDGTLANLRYRGSPPTRLYAMTRVQAIEGTREWQEWFFASRRRRTAAVVVERGGAPPGGVSGGSLGDGGTGSGGTRVDGSGIDGPVVDDVRGGGTGGGGAAVAVGAHVGAERDAGVGRGRDSKGSKGEVA
ncbi:hypothetical protein [Embleya scabrispora]|uniref:hypothetical protein n=1 Tax=Embleya scabrispora TaxID=159449 RepID=UPI0003A2563E|nr:hypothetical protein [Embleya scabrispora]MYS79006.1 hypothetical protein [Streptomyces sp. SID5474]